MFPVSPNERLKISMRYKEIYEGASPQENAYLAKVGLLGKPHLGIDIAPTEDDGGAPLTTVYTIIAPVDGTVVRSGWAPGYGYHVRIQSKSSDTGFLHLFGHMSRLYAKEGSEVKKGASLGVMGSSGSSSAVHLHYEVRDTKGYRVDPAPYFGDEIRKQYNV